MTTKRRRIRIDGVYDLECAEWTKFVCGGYLRANGDYELFSAHKSAPSTMHEQALADTLLANGGTMWAHAGGRYDHKWLIDIAARRGYHVGMAAAGPRIVTAQIKHLALRDSFALIPCSLKELTSGQGVKKQELDLPCVCNTEKSCGGYCSIATNMATPLYNRLTEYLRADCESLLESLLKVQEYADANDLDMSATVGSSSWRTMQRWLGLPNADLSPNEHTFCRRGYYGGRCQLLRAPGAYQVYEYDVASMYPWSMRDLPMPIGVHEHVYGDDARRAMVEQRAGIYQCIIHVPEMHLPPLPYRLPSRIAYPVGNVHGTWSLPEIEYAVSIGCKVLSVQEAIYWRRTQLLFAPYVDKHFELRASAGKKTPVGIWLKFRLNSPTGKFGANPEKDHYLVNPKHVVKCEATNECTSGGDDCGRCCKVHCTRRCGAMSEHSDYIWSEYRYHLDDCAHVEWSAYLTAGARIEWHKQAVSVNGGLDVVYGDTDSIKSLQPRERRLGSKLGEWEYEGKSTLHAIAPKTYWKEKPDGSIEAKAKGLGAPPDKPIEVGKVYPVRGVVGLRNGANIGTLFTPKAIVTEGRKATNGVGDRVLLADGTTRAPSILELEA